MRAPSHRRRGPLPRSAQSASEDEEDATVSEAAHLCRASSRDAVQPLFYSVRSEAGVLLRKVQSHIAQNEPPSVTQAAKRRLQSHGITDYSSHSLASEANFASKFSTTLPSVPIKRAKLSRLLAHGSGVAAFANAFNNDHDDFGPILVGSSLSEYPVVERTAMCSISHVHLPRSDVPTTAFTSCRSHRSSRVRFSLDVKIQRYCQSGPGAEPPVNILPASADEVPTYCLVPHDVIASQCPMTTSSSVLANSRSASHEWPFTQPVLSNSGTGMVGVMTLDEEGQELEPPDSAPSVLDISVDEESAPTDNSNAEADAEDRRDDPMYSEPWRRGLSTDTPNLWAAHIPNLVPGQARRWDLSVLPPKSLWFVDLIQLELPTVGGYQLALFCYDIKSKGVRFFEVRRKAEIAKAVDRFIASEALAKRPYRVTVQGDGCGCMKLVQEAFDRTQAVTYEPLPRNESDLNPAEGYMAHFRERVFATLTHAMRARGAIDERHLIYCAKYVCHVNERLPHGADASEKSAWEIETGQPPSVGHIPPFATPAYVYVPEKLRRARKGPKYLRAEPGLFLGFLSMYSTQCIFLTRHGTVVHSRRYTWEFDVPAGIFPSVQQDEKAADGHCDIETELFTRAISEKARKLARKLDILGDPDTVIRVNRAKIDKCKTKYISERVWAADGLTVPEATRLTVKDAAGQSVPYSLTDIRYDDKCNWILLEHRQELAAAEEAGQGDPSKDSNASSRTATPSQAGISNDTSHPHDPGGAKRGLKLDFSQYNANLAHRHVSSGGVRSIEKQLLSHYRSSLNSKKPDFGMLMQIAHASVFLAQRGLKWKDYLGSKHNAEVTEAYHTEMVKLLEPETGALVELFPTGPTSDEFHRANAPGAVATWTMLLLEVKRSGRWKARLVIRGDQQDAVAINGPDFNYHSHSADLNTVRAGFLTPGRFKHTVVTIDLDNAYCQAKPFPDTDPPRYLFMWDPVLKRKRTFRQVRNLYGSKESGKLFELTFFEWLAVESRQVGLNLVQGSNEPCVFFDQGRNLLVITFVDDVMVMGKRKHVEFFIEKLTDKFACKPPQFLSEDSPIDFVGMMLHRGHDSMYISMEKYCETMYTVLGLDKIQWSGRPPDVPICKPIEPRSTLNSTETKLLLRALGMLGWLSITTRLDLRYAHSRISQHLGNPSHAALHAALYAVRYAYETRTLCIRQSFSNTEANWRCYSDADHAGNSELQNRRRSQTCFIIMNGDAPISWGSKASAVQMSQDRTRSARQELTPTANSRIKDMHADLSSAASEIYSAAIASYEILYISYVCREAGIAYPDGPIPLLIDNTTCIAFAKNSVSRSKLKHIDCSQQWVVTLRDAKLLTPTYVHTAEQCADIGTKILPSRTFVHLRDKLLSPAPH